MTADINRRTVLYGAAAAAGAAALAACSNGGTVAAGNDTEADAASAPAASPTATGQGTAIGSIPAQPSLAAGELGKTSDVVVGGGMIYKTEKVVVTQPTAGQYKCFTAVCTHQGCLVGSIANGAITCPCHGSEYSIKDGSVINGPATQPLASTPITVTGNAIILG